MVSGLRLLTASHHEKKQRSRAAITPLTTQSCEAKRGQCYVYTSLVRLYSRNSQPWWLEGVEDSFLCINTNCPPPAPVPVRASLISHIDRADLSDVSSTAPRQTRQSGDTLGGSLKTSTRSIPSVESGASFQQVAIRHSRYRFSPGVSLTPPRSKIVP